MNNLNILLKLRYLFLLFSFCPLNCLADRFLTDSSYQVCFTPGENCTQLIVAEIKGAKKEVLVQAYSFTSVPIMKALVEMHRKGVKVNVLLDRSQTRAGGFSSARFLRDYEVPTWIDYLPSIAHNKVIIIDEKTVITGSFNFTKAAEEHNAENVIIISDRNVAKKYWDNWHRRMSVAEIQS